MRYLKKFNESVNENEICISEILRKPGWVKIDPPDKEHWIAQLEYKLTDSVKIIVLDLGTDDLPYYMSDSENGLYYTSTYKHNHTKLYFLDIGKGLENYNRMIRICKYSLPFFEKPSEFVISGISNCFISIQDDFNIENADILWGYSDGETFGYFPPFRFSDTLSLSLVYRHDGRIEYSGDDYPISILEGIDRICDFYKIHRSRITVINDDYELIIDIKF